MLGLAVFVGWHKSRSNDPTPPSARGGILYPGKQETLPVVVATFLLPFIDRNPYRHWSKRRFGISVMAVVVIGMVLLTISAVATTPPQSETGAVAGTISEQIALGEENYSLICVECHGAEGETTEIIGVEGLEGEIISPINSQDKMYTLTDDPFSTSSTWDCRTLRCHPMGVPSVASSVPVRSKPS
jgi:hypothetical protein